jgi:hypothetical protein
VVNEKQLEFHEGVVNMKRVIIDSLLSEKLAMELGIFVVVPQEIICGGVLCLFHFIYSDVSFKV